MLLLLLLMRYLLGSSLLLMYPCEIPGSDAIACLPPRAGHIGVQHTIFICPLPHTSPQLLLSSSVPSPAIVLYRLFDHTSLSSVPTPVHCRLVIAISHFVKLFISFISSSKLSFLHFHAKFPHHFHPILWSSGVFSLQFLALACHMRFTNCYFILLLHVYYRHVFSSSF